MSVSKSIVKFFALALTAAAILATTASAFAGPCEEAKSRVITLKSILSITMDPKIDLTTPQLCIAAGQVSVLTDDVISFDVKCETQIDNQRKLNKKEKTAEENKATDAKVRADLELHEQALKLIDDCNKAGAYNWGD